MARRPVKRGSSRSPRSAAASGTAGSPSSNRSPSVSNQAPAPGASFSMPIRFPPVAPARLTEVLQAQVPLPGVHLAGAPAPSTSKAAGAVPAGPLPTTAPPGPAPLPPAERVPRLARVGGAAGATSALEFIVSPISAVAELRPQALGVTYWFDPPATPGPHEVTVRLTGHRLDVQEARTPADDFVAVVKLSDVRPNSGRTALTHRVVGKAAGRWHVTADATAIPEGGDDSDVMLLPSAERVGSSTFAPVAIKRAPGVLVGAWPAMVGLGVALALILQSALARAHGLESASVLVLALVASMLGAVGAKLYYRITHLKEPVSRWLAGLSVQGFVIVATATFVIGGALQGMAVGQLLDATVPALLVGQAVGRLGCLLAGCCAGVRTGSRWGVWSSDRTVGTRRVPVQLMESAAAATLALVTGIIAWRVPTSSGGVLFIGGVAAYVLVRQLLFPLRSAPRSTRHGRQVTLAVALLAVIGSLLVPVFG